MSDEKIPYIEPSNCLPVDSYTDTQLLDALEASASIVACPALMYDDRGYWAIALDGIKSMPEGKEPADASRIFFVAADDWRPTLREAIREYLKGYE